ncbi:hypothetical protein PUR31_03470 [Pseudomonas mosselii]|nr:MULTISPECIES: hypothetical protein [unclassified Pseudomonas]MDD7783149.1 hypothetical protein [Pseudomonas sp. DVZ24]
MNSDNDTDDNRPQSPVQPEDDEPQVQSDDPDIGQPGEAGQSA